MQARVCAHTKNSKATNAVETAAYVKDITLELAGLTDSAEFTKLTYLLTLASLEAQLCYLKFTERNHINGIGKGSLAPAMPVPAP